MRYYQGDNIDFSIDIKQIVGSDAEDWSNFSKVVVCFYTDISYLAKYDRFGIDGYSKLTLSEDSKTYTGEIKHEQTLKMRGNLYMDIRVIDYSGNISTKHIDTGIRIMPTPLKYEENYG